MKVGNLRDKLKKVVLLQPTITQLLICIPTECMLQRQWILQKKNLSKLKCKLKEVVLWKPTMTPLLICL